MISNTALIESILFLETEPVDVRRLAEISELDEQSVAATLRELEKIYEADVHGMSILEVDGRFAISLKPRPWERLKPRYGKQEERKLSRAALETLSIVAYYQPVTRNEIESIRGVKADGMLRLLMKSGLVAGVGKRDIPGRPVQYGTTREFLKRFNLRSIAQLPKLADDEEERFRKS